MATWIVTRSEADAMETARLLVEARQEAIISPVIAITFPDRVEPDLSRVQAVLFTSRYGVAGLNRMADATRLPAFCVGASTAEVAETLGFRDVRVADNDAASLIRAVIIALDPAAGPLFYARGREVTGDVVERLEIMGFEVWEQVVYEADTEEHLSEAAITAISEGSVAGVLFFSPRSAGLFASLVAAAGLKDRLGALKALCLSDKVARGLDSGDWGQVLVAPAATTPSLIELARAEGGEPGGDD